MSLFDRTFLITAGVTAVICGAIYYFLNAKIRDLELALVKQNQVLSSFIANVQQEFRAMARANGTGTSANNMTFEIIRSSNELASPEALAAVAGIDNRKIFITDSDSESDSDSGSDSESDSEADASESDTSEVDTNEADTNEVDTNEADTSEADTTHNKLLICDLSLNDSKIIDMSSLDISHLEIYMSEKPGKGAGASKAGAGAGAGASKAGAGASKAGAGAGADASSSESDEDDSDEEDNSEEDGFHRVSNLGIEQDNLTILKLLNIEDLTTVSDTNKLEETKIESLPIQTPTEPLSENAQTSSVSKYEDLKVDELRKLAVEKDLVKKDEVKKLKKPELLALLKTLTL
jgi:hypothetical protein